MGLSGISAYQIFILLAIVLLIFGTKRIKNAGSDLGHAIRGFKDGIKEVDSAKKELEEDK